MRNLLLTLSFDGTNYHGWQVQKNALTVEEKLQDAIEKVCGKREDVKGCSRTDAGVHAEMFCCSFKTEKEIAPDRLILALNANLPDDIAVYSCREADMNFHARYSCKSKEYTYKIWNSPYRNPFYYKRYLHYKYPLDEKTLNEAAQGFLGEHDFIGFCSAGSEVEDTVREIKKIGVTRCGEEMFIKVEADGFLYNMVRIIVGTLIGVSQGKIAARSIPAIIESKNRENAGVTAPACGLYLYKVFY